MEVIIWKAVTFIIIILIGYVMKKKKVFSVEDSKFLSKLVMNITLPAALIVGFKGVEISFVLLFSLLLGLMFNVIMIIVAQFVSKKSTPTEKAFYMINTSGYNVGNFTIPFVQTFFPASALATICLFDAGNAIMCLGLTFVIATNVAGGKEKASMVQIVKRLLHSVPFDVYIVLLLLAVLNIEIPDWFYGIAGTIGNANGFLAMLMIGIIFEIKLDKSERKLILHIIVLRYIGAIVFGLIIYYLLPLPLITRQVLVIVVFSPVLSVAPILSGKCGCSQAAAGVLNSLCIPISIIFMTGLLITFL